MSKNHSWKRVYHQTQIRNINLKWDVCKDCGCLRNIVKIKSNKFYTEYKLHSVLNDWCNNAPPCLNKFKMKKIIANRPNEIKLNSLTGDELVAYQCRNSKNIAVLAKLYTEHYGFIPLGEPQNKPRFVSKNFYNAIELASEKRKVITFDNKIEFCEWVINIAKSDHV